MPSVFDVFDSRFVVSSIQSSPSNMFDTAILSELLGYSRGYRESNTSSLQNAGDKMSTNSATAPSLLHQNHSNICVLNHHNNTDTPAGDVEDNESPPSSQPLPLEPQPCAYRPLVLAEDCEREMNACSGDSAASSVGDIVEDTGEASRKRRKVSQDTSVPATPFLPSFGNTSTTCFRSQDGTDKKRKREDNEHHQGNAKRPCVRPSVATSLPSTVNASTTCFHSQQVSNSKRKREDDEQVDNLQRKAKRRCIIPLSFVHVVPFQQPVSMSVPIPLVFPWSCFLPHADKAHLEAGTSLTSRSLQLALDAPPVPVAKHRRKWLPYMSLQTIGQ